MSEDLKACDVDHLMHVIDRDRYVVAHGVVAVENEIRGREWLLTGRGPYEWDDDDYRKEFGDALEAIRDAMEPLRKVGWDKSDCTRITERVIAAKEAAAEMLKRPIGPREMINADLFGDPRDKQIEALIEQLREAREALKVLCDLPIVENDAPNTLHLSSGSYQGPAVDWTFSIIRKVKEIAARAIRDEEKGR